MIDQKTKVKLFLTSVKARAVIKLVDALFKAVLIVLIAVLAFCLTDYIF